MVKRESKKSKKQKEARARRTRARRYEAREAFYTTEVVPFIETGGINPEVRKRIISIISNDLGNKTEVGMKLSKDLHLSYGNLRDQKQDIFDVGNMRLIQGRPLIHDKGPYFRDDTGDIFNWEEGHFFLSEGKVTGKAGGILYGREKLSNKENIEVFYDELIKRKDILEKLFLYVVSERCEIDGGWDWEHRASLHETRSFEKYKTTLENDLTKLGLHLDYLKKDSDIGRVLSVIFEAQKESRHEGNFSDILRFMRRSTEYTKVLPVVRECSIDKVIQKYDSDKTFRNKLNDCYFN